jgi:hypothetical protein
MKHLNRRIFLKGLGGAVVAAPFLSSVADRAAKAQSATATSPKAFILMFTHYGVNTNRFFPKKAHGQLTAADLESTSLKSLAPHVDKLLIPRGIRGMNEWTPNLKRGQGNDTHTQVAGTSLTCQPVSPNSDNPFSFDQSTKFNAKPVAASLDHVIAQQISPTGTPMYVRVGNLGENTMHAISYSGPGENYPGVGTPAQVFGSLSGLFKNGGGATAPMTPDEYAAVKGKSILDLVKDDLATLERIDMSSEDKLKIAAWKELLNQTGGVVASAQCSEELAAKLGADEATIGKVKTGGIGGSGDVLTAKVTDTLDTADIYSNLAVLSAICGANPVFVLKYPGNYVFRGLGLQNESHGISHRIGDAGMQGTCLTGVLDMMAKIDEYYAQKFAHLINQLKSVPGAGGTMLDDVVAVWLNEMSDGNAHNLNNLPIIQAGSAGGYFKQGWTVNVEDGTADNMAMLGKSETLCADGTSNMVDGTKQSTGTDLALANAPINKYFCNLMNSLGVKAGEDGFPKKGGTAEVTKFGMYDKTEDFIGGGTKPAKINSPGEFTELKANA